MLRKIVLALSFSGFAMIGAAADSVKLDRATLLNLAKVIRAKNLNCTEPLAAYDMGQDALGVVTRIECSSATFRVTKRPDGSVDVAPWQ